MNQLKQIFQGAFFSGVFITPFVWALTNTPPYPLLVWTILSGFAIIVIQFVED